MSIAPQSTAEKDTLPTRLEDMTPTDGAVLKACYNRDIDALREALRQGGNVEAHFLADGSEAAKKAVFSDLSGRLPIHVAARGGFQAGVALLAHLGADIDAADKLRGKENNALGLTIDTNYEMCHYLMALGADPDMPNALGHSFSSRVHYVRQKIVNNKLEPSPEQLKYTRLYEAFEQVPYQEKLEGLTREELFARNAQGLCLLDNPRMLKRIGEVAEALEKNGTPLTLEDLQRVVPAKAHYLMPECAEEVGDNIRIGVEPARIGEVVKGPEREVTYLERCMQTGALAEAVAALNKQGTYFQHNELLGGGRDKKPTPLMEKALENDQINAFFQLGNWKGGTRDGLQAVYRQVGEDSRWQIDNYQQLSGRLQSQETPKGRGR